MDVKENEIQGGFKWLFLAGSAAILLSCFLFFKDNVVMEGAIERDERHAAEMAELRAAQAHLGARVTDERQILPLLMEQADQQGEPQTSTNHH